MDTFDPSTETALLHRVCPYCGKEYDIEVLMDNLVAWRMGRKIQDAFPGLDANERESIQTGYHGTCFDLAFAD